MKPKNSSDRKNAIFIQEKMERKRKQAAHSRPREEKSWSQLATEQKLNDKNNKMYANLSRIFRL